MYKQRIYGMPTEVSQSKAHMRPAEEAQRCRPAWSVPHVRFAVLQKAIQNPCASPQHIPAERLRIKLRRQAHCLR